MAMTGSTVADGRKADTPDQTSGPRRVTILGSTGSIGQSTVDLLLRNRDAFTVEALTANHNAALLAEQAKALDARFAAIADPGDYPALKEALSGAGIAVGCGRAALVEAAERPADWVMAGIVGAAGLEPTLAAIRQGRIVAFANKEVLVCAGSLFMREVAAHGATLLPVDSEHNAIWQCFDFTRVEGIEKITLTCSGGPFRERSLAAMREATPEQAVAHPTWRMGAKISVDSATLMNKGLELADVGRLTFEAPDEERFPALRLAREVLARGGAGPTVLNAANETAVHAFLAGQIGFLDIAETVERTLDLMPGGNLDTLEDVYHLDEAARATAAKLVAAR